MGHRARGRAAGDGSAGLRAQLPTRLPGPLDPASCRLKTPSSLLIRLCAHGQRSLGCFCAERRMGPQVRVLHGNHHRACGGRPLHRPAAQTGAWDRRRSPPSWAPCPLCPYHSPSRALSTGTPSHELAKLSKQMVAFRESHKFLDFCVSSREKRNKAALSKRPEAQGSPVPACGALTGAEDGSAETSEAPGTKPGCGAGEHSGLGLHRSPQCQPVVLTHNSPCFLETPPGWLQIPDRRLRGGR